MKKILFFFLVLTQMGVAQKSDVLFTINNDKVFVDEFERVYTKNNMNNKADYSKASLEEYLGLFINFKLKVKEAEALRMDTIPALKAELSSYKKQLISSYINDKQVTEELVKEAYERSTKEVDVSHLLIRWPNEYPTATDSATVLKKINAIKKSINASNFAKIAKTKSEDPSAKDNQGRLGYLTVFQTVYPFENAMYSTPKGKVSAPIATRFGYHLVLVHDVRPARGRITTAHILLKSKTSDSPEEQNKTEILANTIYADILSDKMSFKEAAKRYSQDANTKNKGGQLPALTSAEMITSYAEAAYSIETDGGIAKPIRTPIGWHIIKRIAKQEILPYRDSKKEIEMRVAKDSRSDVAVQKNIQDSKEKFGFIEDKGVLKGTIEALKSTYEKNTFTLDKLKEKTLFKIGTAAFTNNDFIAFAKQNAHTIKNEENLRAILELQYRKFQEERIQKYREKNLASINEEYKNLLQEYHDGILLFELTNREVWNKAMEDTTGLKSFFDENRQRYMWGKRAYYSKYVFENKESAEKAIALLNKGKEATTVQKKLNKKEPQVTVKEFKKEKDKFNVSGLDWKAGSAVKKEENGKTVYYLVNEILDEEPKALYETRGYVISDYQNKLENEWIASLKNKYKVVVDEAVFQKLIKK